MANNIKATAIKNARTREKDDYYATPDWCTHVLLDRLALPAGKEVFDPCAGIGSIIGVLNARGYRGAGCEIDAERAQIGALKCADFYKIDTRFLQRLNVWIVTNPPYSKAFEFVQKCVALETAGVAMLLPINWLATRVRQ